MSQQLAFILLLTITLVSECDAQTNDKIPSVKIGEQIWMTKNLDVTTFANGDLVPEAKTRQEWNSTTGNQQPAWCYYDNDTVFGNKYGKLYD